MQCWGEKEPDDEKKTVTDFLRSQADPVYIEEITKDDSGDESAGVSKDEKDELYETALGIGARSTDEQGNILLALKQKEQEQSKHVTTAVDPKTYTLRRIIIGDLFGNTTVIKLGTAEVNLGIPDSFFTFRKPEGAGTVTFP